MLVLRKQKRNLTTLWVVVSVLILTFLPNLDRVLAIAGTKIISSRKVALVTNNLTHRRHVYTGPMVFAMPLLETMKVLTWGQEAKLDIHPRLKDGATIDRTIRIIWEIQDLDTWVDNPNRITTEEMEQYTLDGVAKILYKKYGEMNPLPPGTLLGEKEIITETEKEMEDVFQKRSVIRTTGLKVNLVLLDIFPTNPLSTGKNVG